MIVLWLGASGPAVAQVRVEPPADQAGSTPTVSTRFDGLFTAPVDLDPADSDVPPVPRLTSLRMQDCIARSLERDAAHRGRLELEVETAAGRVAKVTATTDEIRDPVLLECAARQLKGQVVPDVTDATFEWLFIADQR